MSKVPEVKKKNLLSKVVQPAPGQSEPLKVKAKKIAHHKINELRDKANNVAPVLSHN